MCANMTKHLFIAALSLQCLLVESFPEQGKWSLPIGPDQPFVGKTKSMYNNTEIRVKVKCDSPSDSDMEVTIQWVLRRTPCWKEYLIYSQENENFYEKLFSTPESSLRYPSGAVYQPSILKPAAHTVKCDHTIILPPVDGSTMLHAALPGEEDQPATQTTSDAPDDAQLAHREVVGGVRLKRDNTVREVAAPGPGSSVMSTNRPLVVVNSDGVYLIMLHISSQQNTSFLATVDIDIISSYGYLSAADYPLLVFYSCLCVVYVVYGCLWLVLCFVRWRDLLRLQYWIAAVIFMGLVEKAVFVAVYESLNESGSSLRGLLIAAELVSCAKRTIARILVVIVALGFGIVKPRLGALLHRVVVLGLVYFVLASVESCTRALRPKTDPSKQSMLAVIPLALLDSLICWWVFSALVSTMRQLRLRRNPTKLSLYTHFTNVLAAAVLASLAFMVWSIRTHQFAECLSDWKELWVDEAFWHALFALLLLAIMLLWRPTNNNQRFAFSPLLDEGSDCEENEQLMGVLGASTKHRPRGPSSSGASSPRTSYAAEDDLKWVEENIPSSITDSNMAALDSDEEILTTRFEISKMQ